jgi:tripartite-type tricarboxylate transporter receptor subunit TctC
VDAFPNVPVSTALGHNITMPQFRVILVKAGTDPARVKLLSDALAKAVQSSDFKEYLKDQYADPASFVPANEAIKYMQAWLEDAKKIIASTAKK